MLTAIDLRVDDDPQPLGLDHAQPAFSWVPTSQERVQAQQAYQILVASSLDDLAADRGTMWDSGQLQSNQTLFIPYDGAPLAPAQGYYWKVRLWDQDGACGDWSAPAHFGTGLFQQSDWAASWIGRGPQTEPQFDFDVINGYESAEAIHGPIPTEDTSALLRREFSIDKPIRRAVVFVCGLGFYDLHINGQRVGENRHTPSKTDYRQQVLYDAYDVTDLLQQSDNAVGMILGNGWYNPNKKYWDWHMQWHGSKRVLLQLHIEHEDGSQTQVCTDGAWTTSIGPVQEHCLYDGELYDARLEQPGWDSPGFDDGSWTPANQVEAPGGVLRFHAIEPVRITETIRPKTMWEAEPGVFVYDMGQNFSGFVRLRVRGPAGATVLLRHAENLHPDGTLDPDTNFRALNEDRYILKGEGEEVYEPFFVYHGFQYVELSGFPGKPTLDSITGMVLHTSSPQTGELHTSHPLINHIHRCTVWGQRSNMMGMPTDDNQRDERLGWMADGHLAAEQFMCNFEPTRFYRKWLRDMKCAQNPETGSVPYIVPRPYFSTGSQTPAWSSAYPLVAWYLYEYTGDKRILEEHLEPICRYVDFLGTQATDDILPKDNYGDHLSITDTWKRSEPLLASTFYYYYDALLASQMAGILGKPEVEKTYAALAKRIRDAFNARFLSDETDLYGKGTQCEQILPLWLEMEPLGKRGNVFAALLRDIMEMNQGHLRVGILGAKYALDLLMAEGRHDVLWTWATREDYPSFGYMTKGYTTLSETWQRTGTNNHVMWGHIDTWFYEGLAGIRCALGAAGFDRILIQPYVPAGVEWVRGALHTLRGRVASGWQRRDGLLQLDVSIPANTTGEIRLPAACLRDNIIFEGETRIVWNAAFCPGTDGVLGAAQSGDYVVLQVGSGDYRFTCDWKDIPANAVDAMKSPWRVDCGEQWKISRLLDAQDVAEAPCVSLADSLEWQDIRATPFISVHELTDMADGLVYLAKRVRVDEPGEWLLHIGHDGGVRVFVDNEAVAVEPRRMNPATRMRTMATVSLDAGEYEVVVAFDTDKGMGWGIYASWEIPHHARILGKQPAFPVSVE